METGYIIRQVKKEDSKRIWQIRNHPLIRKNSNNPEKIPFKKHVQWFEKKYFSGLNNYCFILEDKNKKVIGYCRFDFDKDEYAYILSIALEPKHHRQGLGSYLLKESLKRLTKKRDILAITKKDNLVAIRLFQKNHFKLDKKTITSYYLKYSFNGSKAFKTRV